ncbi:MAG: discoidin domain-containing protein, partial [Bacteroidales bacterium]|nr:discoidin domain-containing protein [Bacteroidales bacterium]
MNLRHFFLTGLSALLLAACTSDNPSHTRGTGIYPGSPDEYDGPLPANAGNDLRNLALMRAAWASSSIDYNLTAQLATDGILSETRPYILETITSNGIVPKNMREKLLDNHRNTRVDLRGNPPFVIFHFVNGMPPQADRMTADATFLSGPDGRRSPAQAVFEASQDGQQWFPFEGGSYPWYRVTFPGTGLVNVREVNFIKDGHSLQFAYDNRHENSYRNDDEVEILTSKHFNSCWMSEGNSDEWLYIDLGKKSSLEKVILRWINKAVEGRILISDDAASWNEAASLPGGDDLTDEIALKGKARYVKVEMKSSADGNNFILSEMEVLGRGGMAYAAQEAPKACNGTLELRRGAWMLRRAEGNEAGENISTTAYDPKGWLPATVPGTVTASYENIGAIPRINYDMDQLQISESYFLSDFWYRDTFTVPEDFGGRTLMLEFDGINWKADIYLNGTYVGDIDGCFT